MLRRVLLNGLLGLALLAVAGVATGLRWTLAPRLPGAPEILFEVERGATLSQIAGALEHAGLVRSAAATEALARWRELTLRAGEYRLSAAMSPAEILARLAEGRVATWEVSIPEGFTMVQIARRLGREDLVEADAFLAVARDPRATRALGVEGDTLEGYLFPETYRIPRGLAPLEIARTMVEEFLAVWRELEPSARAQDLSMHEVVTLASIVEKETGAPAERPLIASVFRNRLRRGMRLETDPTVIYGIPDFDGNLRRVHLEDDGNPYNTYRIRGLPPGPIASPGRDALRAVVHPAESDYLYFVSRNDGTHRFSRSYAEHARAVERYQRRRSK